MPLHQDRFVRPVSSAYLRAIKWGLATVNPVTHSDLPRLKKRAGLALLPAEQDLLTACSLGPWCLQTFLEMCVATGCRRGEVLALRWSDIRNNKVFVDRSLCQTRDGLVYKTTKTESLATSHCRRERPGSSKRTDCARISSAGSSARATAPTWT